MVAILGVIFLTVSIAPALAQEKQQKSPGGYHGELDFPISWKRYYSYAEWTEIMLNIQKKYPHISDIESIGKSRMGRDQFYGTRSVFDNDHGEVHWETFGKTCHVGGWSDPWQ
jgi:hypothetical protein